MSSSSPSNSSTPLIRPLGVVLASSPNLHMWPLSRSDMPIQFVRDDDGFSPFQKCLIAIQKLSLATSPIISLNAAHLDFVRDQCAEIELAHSPFVIVEPVHRGTLPSLATAALFAARRDRQAMMMVIDAHRPPQNQQGFDHLTGQMRGAKEALTRMVVGVQPQHPRSMESKLNLHVGAKVGTNHMFEASGQQVPDHLNTLERNGIIFSTPRVALQALSLASRSCVDACSLALEASKEASNAIWPQMNIWSSMISMNLASALPDATEAIYLRPMDLGTPSYHKTFEPTANGSRIVDLNGSLLVLQDCPDLDIISHADAALIKPAGSLIATQQALASLRDKAHHHLHSSAQVTRNWGIEEIIESQPSYQIARLTIKPGHKMSAHFHNQRSEAWTVLTGQGMANFDGKDHAVKAGSVIALPKQTIHSLTNSGNRPLVVIESRHGDMLSRNDHIRIHNKTPMKSMQA